MQRDTNQQPCPGSYQPVLEEQAACIRYICDVCGDEAEDLLGPEPCRRLIPLPEDGAPLAPGEARL